MNKQDNKLTLSVLATLTAAIALIYTLIMYHDIIYAVIGTSLFFLITAFILTRNFITFSTMKNKSLNVQLKTYIDDISTQLETMGGAQSQIGKATYLYTKQAAQAVTTLENNYIESQEALYKNLASLSSAQIKTSKLILRNDQNNAIKITTSIKDIGSQLRDTMTQSFDRLQPAHPELATTLEEIVHYLKNQPDGTNQELLLQLNHIAQELQNISNRIQQVQVPAQSIASVSPPSDTVDFTAEPLTVPETEPALEDFAAEMTAIETSDSVVEETIAKNPDDIIFPDDSAFSPASAVTEEAADIDEMVAEELKKAEPLESVTTINDSDSNSNKTLSADEIAALFDAADPAPKRESHPAYKNNSITQTEGTSTDISPVSENSNKKLSPDEIAALVAALN